MDHFSVKLSTNRAAIATGLAFSQISAPFALSKTIANNHPHATHPPHSHCPLHIRDLGFQPVGQGQEPGARSLE